MRPSAPAGFGEADIVRMPVWLRNDRSRRHPQCRSIKQALHRKRSGSRRHRMRVGGLDLPEPGECGYQHEEGGARQVEVGQQYVDRPEPVAGQNEQSGLAGKGPDLSIFGRRALQQAQAGSAGCNDTPAGVTCRRDMLGGLGRQHVRFGAHLVVARVGGLE